MKIVIGMLLLSTGFIAVKSSKSGCLLQSDSSDLPKEYIPIIEPPSKEISVKQIDPKVIDTLTQKLASEGKKLGNIVCATMQTYDDNCRTYVLQLSRFDVYEAKINVSGDVKIRKRWT